MSSPSEITIPSSDSMVSVKAFDILRSTSSVPANVFLEPVLPGREAMVGLPAYSFLIEHGKRRVMFDLGPRKDMENYAPKLKEGFPSLPGFNVQVDKDVVEQLTEGGVELGSIDTVIWSHTHLDHT
ncbi:hypothetical protein V5O48_019649, partial [Marasmius crinis-equi]